MNNNAITRDEAIELLGALIDTNMFADEVEEKLADIMNAIENEKYGLHMWGADNAEYATLCTAVREDTITDEDREEGGRIWDKYSFEPSPFEKEEIDNNLADAIEEE